MGLLVIGLHPSILLLGLLVDGLWGLLLVFFLLFEFVVVDVWVLMRICFIFWLSGVFGFWYSGLVFWGLCGFVGFGLGCCLDCFVGVTGCWFV